MIDLLLIAKPLASFYLISRIVDWWAHDNGRLFREGEAVFSGELAGGFERLRSNAENWQARLQKLAAGRLLGRFFATSRARLREVAERLGVHHLANLAGCAAR